jgi:hypothetical protein
MRASAREASLSVLLAGVRRYMRGTRVERVPDRLFEGEEPVLHLMGWVGHSLGHGRFVDGPDRGRGAEAWRASDRRTDGEGLVSPVVRAPRWLLRPALTREGTAVRVFHSF